MNPVTVGLIGMGLLILTLFTGMPVAFALALVGAIGISWLGGLSAGLNMLCCDMFEVFFTYPLTVITMFVLMGSYAFLAGIGSRTYDTSNKLFGAYRGGLAIATVVASTAFGAVCGSSAATCATMGRVSLPEMKKYGYADSLSTGIVTASGGLGILIPPSAPLIVYGIITEQSIGKLFISGVVPGLMLTISFIFTIFVVCWYKPALAPSGTRTSTNEKLRSLAQVIDSLILFGITIGGLFAGWFSPTQAGAIGAGGALLIGMVTRQISWQGFIAATREGLVIACMVLCLIAGATVFSHFLAFSTLTVELIDLVTVLPIAPVGVIVIICIIFLFLGCFIDTMSLIVILVPLFYPVVIKLGYDPIWFGIVIIMLAAVGLVTPPVGVNAFVVHGMAENVPLGVVFKGTIPFIFAYVFVLMIIISFPQLVSFLSSIVVY